MQSKAIVAVCIFVLLGMVACNGSQSKERNQAATSSETPPAATPASPPSESDARPVIVAFGDSLTQGVSGKSYPAFLQDRLDRAGYHYRVDNQGVAGDTTADGLARIDNVIAEKPALVVLEFGGNDGLRGVPVDSTRKNLDEMIRKFKTASIPVVLAGITLPPNYGPDYVKPFTAIFPDLAKKYHLRYIPFLLQHVYSDPNLMQPDGIHPNQAGNEIVAKDVFDLIQPMLAKPQK
ncbi:MAG TPA: arylesterase [Bryobacteraceae bacterium]|nr:arylesterase [Bryobacteraceae bacterium]